MVHAAADGTIGVTLLRLPQQHAGRPRSQTDYFLVHCHPTAPTPCTNTADWGDVVQLTDAVVRHAPDRPFAPGYVHQST